MQATASVIRSSERGAPPLRFPSRLATILKHRQVLGVLVRKDFDTRYAGSLLGILWTQIYPLIMLAVYTFFFTVIFKSDVIHYPLFLFVGIVIWTFFSTALSVSTNSVLHNGSLITNINFPNELVTMSAVVLALIDLATSHVIVFVGIAAYGLTPSWTWLALPLIVVLLAFLCLGLGLLLAAANVYLRDVKFFVDVGLLMLMFLSPVFYSEAALPQGLSWLARVNPVAIALIAYRHALLDHVWPESTVWLHLGLASLLSLLIGLEVFPRWRRGFVDAL